MIEQYAEEYQLDKDIIDLLGVKDIPIESSTNLCCSNTVSWAVVVVKWSARSPSTPTIRVRIPLTPTVFLYKLCLKKMKINKKKAGVGPFLKKHGFMIFNKKTPTFN